MPTDEEFDEPDRVQLINELIQTLGFSETNITTWLCAWFADVGCLRQLIEYLQTSPLLQASLSEEFDSRNSIFKGIMKTWLAHKHDPEASKRKKVASSTVIENPRPSKSVKVTAVGDAGPSEPSLSAGSSESSLRAAPLDTKALEKRSQEAKEQARDRNGGVCIITKEGYLLEICHIYPFALNKRKGTVAQDRFWKRLTMFWPPGKVESWKKTVTGPHGTEACRNLVGLVKHAHAYWGEARFALKPIEKSDDGKSLVVQFFWMPEPYKGDAVSIDIRPSLPSDVECAPLGGKLYDTITEKPIHSGHTITLATPDPSTHPLPSWELLEMQWVLHRICALAGAAEPDDDDGYGDFPEDTSLSAQEDKLASP